MRKRSYSPNTQIVSENIKSWQSACYFKTASGWVPGLCWKLWQIAYRLRREGTGTLLPLMFHKNGYQSCCYLTEKLVCIISSICVACIDHMKRMRFRDFVHGKCADVTFFGNNRVVQETDADPACNQCLDRNKAAEGEHPSGCLFLWCG